MKLTADYLNQKEAQFRKLQGELLETSRKSKGLSQSAAGNFIGVSKDVISNFEVGRSNVPPYRLLKLAQLYQKPISFFYNVGSI